MRIGKQAISSTAISAARADAISIRGKNLATELMGKKSFVEFFFFLATGRDPTENQSFFLEMSLVGLAEHGLTPSVQAARMTFAADPAALQGAVAAGVLGCGTVILGAAGLCRSVIEETLNQVEAGKTCPEAALSVATAYRETRRPIPGYGHPLHKPVDPRAERMLALADSRGVAARGVAAARALARAVAEVWGKPLPMNISMSIAATMYDLDVPNSLVSGIPILARTAGLIAHLSEEARTPIGFYLSAKAEEAVEHTATFPEAQP
jgi:citrate synthase